METVGDIKIDEYKLTVDEKLNPGVDHGADYTKFLKYQLLKQKGQNLWHNSE